MHTITYKLLSSILCTNIYPLLYPVFSSPLPAPPPILKHIRISLFPIESIDVCKLSKLTKSKCAENNVKTPIVSEVALSRRSFCFYTTNLRSTFYFVISSNGFVECCTQEKNKILQFCCYTAEGIKGSQ
jgi:hypothetical protein